MCGIAGYLSFAEPASEAVVSQMCTAMRHRGPDDEGIYTDGPCGIGMRRLSIIDLHTGHQPIPNEDRSMWIVFNGEVYNFQELRPWLEGHGHRFTTLTDTEALLHTYEQEGIDGVKRLRGMFAYAIWDTHRQQLYIARDRFGKKPVYYVHIPGKGLYFASEIKCLLTLAELPREMDEEALRIYLQFAYIPDPHSIYKHIRKLPPGHWMTVDRQENVRTGRYWDLPHPTTDGDEDPGLTEEQACADITRVFDESVRLRMISDVPVGAFLSGGIDSSLVVATMAGLTSEPVRTFSIGWEEREFNELPLAALVAKKYRTEHHEILVRPDVISLVPKLLRFFDEPFADSSAIPTFLVSQFAAQHVKVVLSGDGGDELFGGYPSFFQADQERRFDQIPLVLRHLLSGLAGAAPYRAYGKNFLRAISRPGSLERYFESMSFSSYFLRERTLEPEWRTPADLEFYRRTFGSALMPDGADPLTQAMYFEGTAKLAGDILVKVDRMAMANSLEVRSPLLDHKLAELAATLPNRWKTSGGRGKLILLKALQHRLPPELLSAPKRGFGVPLAAWFRGPLREMLHDLLTSREFESRGITRKEPLREMLAEHDSGRRNNAAFLWQLLALELWFHERSNLPTLFKPDRPAETEALARVTTRTT